MAGNSYLLPPCSLKALRKGDRVVGALALVFFLASAGRTALAAEPDRAGIEFFEKKVRPVLVQHCYKCHSAQAKSIKGGLRLDSREGVRGGGDSGPAVVPGKPEESLLLKAMRHTDTALRMPPKQKLPAAVVRDVERDEVEDWTGGR